MMPPGLIAWVVLAAMLHVGGLLAAVLGGGDRRCGVLAMLAGAVVLLAALGRHDVVDGTASSTALITLVGGGLLMLSPGGRDPGGDP